MKGFKRPPRTPARAIINNSTISIFLTDNFGDIKYSVNLKELKWDVDASDKNCIILVNKRNKETAKFCAVEYSRESMAD